MAKRVFIIDEDEALINQLTKDFVSAGYEVLSAKNGKEAIEDLNINNVPHLIITETDLPEVSGLEFCKEARRDNRTKKVPIVVNYKKNIYEKPYRDIGVEEFLHKPLNIPELLKLAEILTTYGSRANIPVKPKANYNLIAIIFVIIAVLFLIVMIVGVNNIPFFKK
jgi:CheY-like chemotaxis protein